MKQLVDRAIVLRRVNYGERDRVVTMLTKQNGKITVFAKGVRSQKSKLSAGIELFSVSEVGFIDGKSEMKTLTGARLIMHFDAIVHDIEKTRRAFDALKHVAKIVEERGGQEYFDLMEVYLSSLQNSSFDKDLVELWFGLKLLSISGVLGDIDVRKTDKELRPSRYSFDYGEQFFMQDSEGGFSENDVKLLRLLGSRSRPIQLEKELSSSQQLLHFTDTLFSMNLA